MEVVMFRKLTFAAAIVLGSMALSVPVFAANEGGEVGFGASEDFNQMEAGGGGFAESQDAGVDRVAKHRDGYDGDRYWSNGECFPTAPGACD
jgi:hypothetical protein